MSLMIKKLNLVKFGKFKNFEIEPTDGLNVVFGVNEAGKSTLNLFVKAMLYGLPSRKKSGEKLKERERIIPWDERFAEGVMTVEQNGRMLEIRRRFGKNSAGDKFDVCDAVGGEKIDGFTADNTGEKLLGISRNIFEKTLWIGQSGAYMGGRDDDILKRIANLGSGGDENVSVKEAVEKLEALKRKLKAKDGRSTPGVIDVLNDRLEECRREKYELSTKLSQTEASRLRKKKAEEELAATEKELEVAEADYKKSIEYERVAADRELYSQIRECEKKLEMIYSDERYRTATDLDEEIINTVAEKSERCRAIENEYVRKYDFDVTEKSEKKEEFERKKIGFGMMSGGGAVITCLGAIMIIVSLIASIESKPFLATSVLTLLLGTVILSIGIKNLKNSNNVINTLSLAVNEAKEMTVKVEKELSELKGDIDNVLVKYGVKSLTELRSLYITEQGLTERARSLESIKSNLSDGIDIEKLKVTAEENTAVEYEKHEDIAKRLEKIRERQLSLVSEIKGLESKMAYQVGEYRIPADIDTEINSIKVERQKALDDYAAVELAISTIESAAEEWNSSVTPEIVKSVNEVMNFITDGKYNHIRVSDDFEMRVVSGSDIEDAEYFSRGTYEQLYFALRFALSKFALDGAPLFLDDILTMYDDERAESLLKMLKDSEKCGQIIIFTCHRYTEETARKIDAHVIDIG